MTDNDSTGSHPLWTFTHGKLHISGAPRKVDPDVGAHVCCVRKRDSFAPFLLCNLQELNIFLNLSNVQ